MTTGIREWCEVQGARPVERPAAIATASLTEWQKHILSLFSIYGSYEEFQADQRAMQKSFMRAELLNAHREIAAALTWA